jgi:YgiT-type zinc finger domain-containing protein
LEGDRCDFCESGGLTGRRVREYYRVGTGMVVMDDVPAYVCAQCGHRYYEAAVAKEMREIARQRTRLKERVSFPRVSFKRVRVPRPQNATTRKAAGGRRQA